MVKHMKEHLIGKVVSDVEHVETNTIYGLIQKGMKISFEDGTTILIDIQTDEDLNDEPNLDWKIENGERKVVAVN